MSRLRISASILLVLALVGTTMASASESLPASVDGRVTSQTEPLRSASVYAYQLADLSLEKVTTGTEGEFSFAALPVGLYKIIAFKPGFVPAVVMLSRMAADASQFLDLELNPHIEAADAKGGFWELREKIPSDVLRDIRIAAAEDNFRMQPYALEDARFSAQMTASTGVHDGVEYGNATVAGGELDIEGQFRDFLVGITGNFSQLQPESAFGRDTATGRTQQLALDLVNPDQSRLQLSSVSNSLTTFEHGADSIDFQHHMVSWTQPIGRRARSEVTAQYTQENNYYNQGPIETLGLPESSRALRVEGSYTTPLTQRATLQAGFRYRDLESQYTQTPLNAFSLLPTETVELFSRGGVQVKPAVVVEYGLFSTLRDGSLSLVPQGGLVVNLSDKWRAGASVSHRIDQTDDKYSYRSDFTPAFFNDGDACEHGAEYCYKLMLSRVWGQGENLSLGAVHRKYSDTMRMYFDRDFYDRLESLFFVPGDELPEVQFEMTRRLTPDILTRLESNVASGGGGILVGSDQTNYENSVSYMVTSLDTRFEGSATGVFVAFHHLQQTLDPLAGQPILPTVSDVPSFSFGGFVNQPLAVNLSSFEEAAAITAQGGAKEVEMQRLQLMLSQDLSILHRLAADWAVHVNMELSRGITPDGSSFDEDELRKRLTGGIAVKF